MLSDASSSQGSARFVVYRDQRIAGEADDIAQALAQAKEQGDLLNACAVRDRLNQIIIIVTGWVPIGGEPFEIRMPDELEQVRQAFEDGFAAGRQERDAR